MKANRHWIILGIIGVAILLMAVLFPVRSPEQTGSTFSKTPDGYGAWYAYMKQQGYPIVQLQKDVQKFIAQAPTKGTTLVRIMPDLPPYTDPELSDWIEQGNRLVLLGIEVPATKAPFKSSFTTDQGEVIIETKRRLTDRSPISLIKGTADQHLLKDAAGSVVWANDLGKGKIIYVATPYLAANAYQDSPGNFAYLAHLVNPPQNQIVVDEVIHGYLEKEELTQNAATKDWQAYLFHTPLAIIALQAVIITLICIWGQNRRFGSPIPLPTPTRNNNLDYIDALGEVLFKAESYGFLVHKISRAEQIYLQQKLGLGATPLPLATLAAAWADQGRGTYQEIMTAFAPNRSVKSMGAVANWLHDLARLRKKLG